MFLLLLKKLERFPFSFFKCLRRNECNHAYSEAEDNALRIIHYIQWDTFNEIYFEQIIILVNN